MSTADNKTLIQKIFQGLADRNGTLFIDSMADDCRWTCIGANSWSGTFTGKPAILADLLGPLRERLVERSRTVAHRFVAEGDHVIVEARGDNVTKTGVRYANEYCFVFRLDNGRILDVKEYCDTELVTKALGDRAERLEAAQ